MVKSCNNKLMLESNDFLIFCNKNDINSFGWGSFYYENKGFCRYLLDTDVKLFFIDLFKICNSNNGKDNNKHLDVLNKKSKYLGYINFSGYDTIYLFKNDLYIEILILNGNAEYIAHHKISFEILEKWELIVN